ncbi:hypothetical protein [Portibacter marinus]|uniref:hypothetical protein n=1 Tax=Portibacter marinus TaxID=2898660 RepID=UPI001F1F4307|nr:hypothetical protein [Portibacter marinus]
MNKFTFTFLLAAVMFFLGLPQTYATDPISPEAASLIIDFNEGDVAKEGNIFQKFFKRTKTKFKAVVAKVKSAYYKVAASARSNFVLFLVLGLAGILMSILAGSSGITFLSYAAIAAYIASAIFFVMWIIALV